MGDTRVDAKSSRYVGPADGGCDDHNLTCGDNMSRGQPQQDPPDIGLADAKPVVVATVAANLSDAQLRAEYQKMSDAQLDDAHRALESKLTTQNYAGAGEDQTRLRVIEDVIAGRSAPKMTSAEMTAAKERADAAQQDAEAWRSPFHAQAQGYGIEKGGAVHDGTHLKLLDGHVKLGTAHSGIQGTIAHAEGKADFGSFDLSASGDAGAASYDVGTQNADGSVGGHGGGGVTIVGAEATVHKKGVGSITLGLSAGASVELSEGYKKEGNTTERCTRVGFAVYTVGICYPTWRM